MPVATIKADNWDRVELKSLEGAFISVRPLPFGKKLERRDKATRMFMESEGRTNKGGGADQANTNRLELEMVSKWSTRYDFMECIGDHNLEDTNNRKLDFKNRMDFELLDPRVGSEIEQILDKLNNEDEEFNEEDFTKLQSSASTVPNVSSNSLAEVPTV